MLPILTDQPMGPFIANKGIRSIYARKRTRTLVGLRGKRYPSTDLFVSTNASPR